MYKVQKTVMINAGVEKVYGFMKDPMHLPEIWPSMVEIKNVRLNAKGWSLYEWVYKMGGMKFDGESDTISVTENKHVVTESTKGIQSHFDFTYNDVNGKTEVVMVVEYSIPIPLIKKLAEQIIGKLNEHEAEVMLANLKARMEG